MTKCIGIWTDNKKCNYNAIFQNLCIIHYKLAPREEQKNIWNIKNHRQREPSVENR